MLKRAVSLGTAIDFRACHIPPKAIVVSQKNPPKSRCAEIGERRLLLFMRARPRPHSGDGQTGRPELN
jgi:hypothetical protein